MASINKVIIVGRLGQDPEVRQFQNGGSLTSINVATSDRWTDKNTGEQKEQTEWHRISLFNRLGEIAAQYLRKGSLVYIEGSLHTRKYTDQQGIERYSTEVRANQMQMLDRRDNNGGGNGGDWQGNQGHNNRNFGGGYNNQQNNQWGNQGGQHGGYQGNNGFGGNAPQQGGYQNGFNNQPQNGFGQNTPNYQNNNSNQGFGQAPQHANQGMNMNQGMNQNANQGGQTGQGGQDNTPTQNGANPFMGDKPAPKAVTPPSASGVADDDMPF